MFPAFEKSLEIITADADNIDTILFLLLSARAVKSPHFSTNLDPTRLDATQFTFYCLCFLSAKDFVKGKSGKR